MARRGNGFPNISPKGGKGDDSLGLISAVEKRQMMKSYTAPLLRDGIEDVLRRGAGALHSLPAPERQEGYVFSLSLFTQTERAQQAVEITAEATPDPGPVDLTIEQPSGRLLTRIADTGNAGASPDVKAAYAIPIVAKGSTGDSSREVIGTLLVDSPSGEAAELFGDPTFQAMVATLASEVAPYLEVYNYFSQMPRSSEGATYL